MTGSHQKGRNVWWSAEVEWRTELLEPGNKGACFFLLFVSGLTFGRLGVNHGISQDGRVAVLTVFRV